MGDGSRDSGFAQLVTAQRERLLGAAYLVSGDREAAEDLVALTLAQVYARWPGEEDAGRAALRRVLHAAPGRVDLPWRSARVVLRDVAGRGPQPDAGLLADLSTLDREQRRCVVARSLLGLTEAQLATVTGDDPIRSRTADREGRERLAARQPLRRSEPYLAQELRTAVAWTASARSPDVGADRAHGRFLVRRRVVRAGLVAVAVLVVAVLGLGQLVGQRPSADPPVSTPPPAPASPSPTCAISLATCRVAVVQDWRSEMARVTTAHLDPGHHYFSGYTYSAGRRYESAGLWNGAGGVLGLDVVRLNGGGTTVYLQIATDQRYAPRCGQQTGRPCQAVQFMDGNSMQIGGGTHVSDGLEVQYSPDGVQVVTVVARNTSAGRKLDLSTGDLVALVEDAAVHLPPR